MKKGMKVAVICACLGTLWGCGNQQNISESREEIVIEAFTDRETENFEEETEMDAKRMTREYIIEQGLFTEEELAGVDVEAILERYKWVEGDENKRTWRTMLQVEIKEQLIETGLLETIDYSYLSKLNERENGLSSEELENIRTVAFQYNSGTYFETIILDREKSKMYLGETCDLLTAGVVPPAIQDMDADTWSDIVALLDTCDIPNWKKRYQGTSEGTTGHFWWLLMLELKDDEVCSYSGGGVLGKSTPDQYQEFIQGLRGLFE